MDGSLLTASYSKRFTEFHEGRQDLQYKIDESILFARLNYG
jgi:hypothetical protein